MPGLISRLLVALAFSWAGSAYASLVQYDVTLNFDNSKLGYLLFEDPGPIPGNIISDLVDWSFSYMGVEVNSANTQVADFSDFTVDSTLQVDVLHTQLCLQPLAGYCGFDPTGPLFLFDNLGSEFAMIMGDSGEFVATLEPITISAPKYVSAPLTTSLLGLALLALRFSRRKGTLIRGRIQLHN